MPSHYEQQKGPFSIIGPAGAKKSSNYVGQQNQLANTASGIMQLQNAAKPSFASLSKDNGRGFFGGNFASGRARYAPAEPAFANAAPEAQENATAFNRDGEGLGLAGRRDRGDEEDYGRGFGPHGRYGFRGMDPVMGLALGREDYGRRGGRFFRHMQRKMERNEQLGEFRSKVQDLISQAKAEFGLDPEAPLNKEFRKEFREVYKDQLLELREQYLSGFIHGRHRGHSGDGYNYRSSSATTNGETDVGE